MQNRDKTSVGSLDDLAAAFKPAHDDFGRFAGLDNNLDADYAVGMDGVNKDAPVAAAPKRDDGRVVDSRDFGIPMRLG